MEGLALGADVWRRVLAGDAASPVAVPVPRRRVDVPRRRVRRPVCKSDSFRFEFER